MSALRTVLIVLCVTTVLIHPNIPIANAQEAFPATISGRVVHGTDPVSFDPTSVVVTLNELEGVTAFDPVRITPAGDGTFEFQVMSSSSRTYFIGVEYQGARYSETLVAIDIPNPLLIQVYDSTHEVSVLQFTSYSVIVAGAMPEEGWVEIIERASVRNDSGMTLIPNQAAEGPAMLSFLRFGLPSGAYNLDVRSSLVGGDIITVDRGFALTTPVLPTDGDPHLFEFVYRLNYEKPSLDLTRTMRFGAESFRYVVPADTGRPSAPQLNDLGATELNERFLRLLETTDIEPGEVIQMSVSELPMPSPFQRVRGSASEWYVRFVAPSVVIAALALAVFLNLRRRQKLPLLDSSNSAVSVRSKLHARLGNIESRLNAGSLSQRDYDAYRAQITEALVDLRIRMEHDSPGGK